ncbi:tail fiber assembly protein (gpg) [Escherichia coli]|uniref:Tail fiber assembly protein (Gpg) n=1 Tax=Escherichia coli TaxID=562 RepID=A0AAX2KL29_ECOLX|nr:tail fiber assembly protein (gpg) [Escherichia coli]
MTITALLFVLKKDVSAINPEGASVVELPDITANRRADISGKWMFKDGVVIKRTYTEEEQRQQAENEKQSLLQLVRDKTQLWTHSYGWASFPTRINKN